MLLQRLVEVSGRVAAASSRLEKVALLAGLLREVEPAELEIATAFLSGSVRQAKLGVGWAALGAAAAGPAAGSPTLAMADVDAAFEQIAAASGKGSARLRRRLLGDLLSRATEGERRFLVSLVHGELRQGAVEGTVLEAVAQAAGVPSEQARRAFMTTGDLPRLARAMLLEGPGALAGFGLQLFRPVLPMLAETAADVRDALERLGRAALEYKLDGARIQVHKAGDQVRIFSRRLNQVTEAVPELVDIVRALSARDLVLDGEAIALQSDGTPYPFQTTMRRFGRKFEVARLRQELSLTPFFFDLLYLDGEAMLDQPQQHRFDLLRQVLPARLLVPHTVTASVEEAEAFLRVALQRGHEGIMAKALDAPYTAGGRGQRWLKVKPARTLDLVVLAAEWGHGRRRGWLSNLHLGARDPEHGGFVMLGKTFKGMTDEMLAWQTEKLLELETGRDQYTVYVRPELVVEVAFNDVQASPQYPGGVALRFARLKGYRPDKAASETDTIEAVRGLLRRATAKNG